MSKLHPFTPSVSTSLLYEPPGAWIPPVAPNCIRLHAGYPAADLVPVDALAKAMQSLFEDERDRPLQYTGSTLAGRLHTHITTRMIARGIHITDKTTLITAGSADAINLLAQTMLTRETVIAVESPTYMEALETFRNFTDRILELPVDAEGLMTDALADILATRARQQLSMPKLLYTIPSFQNPTGANMPLDRRLHLLELAKTYDFLIIEDDAYGELYFESAPQPLAALDQAGRVIYLGSLSKVIAPGLRIGWVTAPRDWVETIGRFKKDLSHPLTEALTAAYLERIDWPERLQTLRTAYRTRRDILLSALERHMPAGVSWNVPQGGYFVWLHCQGIDTLELLPEALRAGVSYVAGVHFYAAPAHGRNQLRLSYSYVDPEYMVKGVEILAEVINNR